MTADPGRPLTEPTRFLTTPAPTAVLVAPARQAGGPRPVINATGILLHDGLGRAPLSPAARTALDAAAGTCDVEVDLVTGRRGRRGRTAMTALAAAVPMARSVHVVNNNAAALILSAAALAGRREIVISRGELIETADGLRLPELLTSTGARLREVGTTNRTTLGDYADAIGPGTGFVLRVHPPSYRVVGLTTAPALADLAELCAGRGVPLVGDPGSGLLHPEPTLPDEPDASTWLSCGVSLVTTCGDKLLGGPQCGLVLGRADLVDRLRRHPLARALRVGKLTLAALEATLGTGDNPVRRSLRAEPAELRHRAERLASWLRQSGVPASAVTSRAVVGSDGIDDTARAGAAVRRGAVGTGAGHGGHTVYGSGPDVWESGLPSAAVALDAALAAFLRRGRPSVLGRVEQGCCLLDLRSVPPDLDPVLAATVLAAAAESGTATAGDLHALSADTPASTVPSAATGWTDPARREDPAGWEGPGADAGSDVDAVTLQ
ncbi:L-seryl-tRNA(Sec) selenium transferase [Parafrankia sp. Ea1.12]|uniref:L-seryl-tRNA(Sec) selenium transferase n=1 Tax=Parafrankia sp. Ea1.12 TaxID=573499 RepID=UPI000DA47691|nr:L-seryl-tRNA(Sec) selenium transferase [Parafrankia sp. Ea1.12]SQD97123.1 L-seryl-tRNA(Sec) selenium transferase [Parafrankia sp. Ea1.12]